MSTGSHVAYTSMFDLVSIRSRLPMELQHVQISAICDHRFRLSLYHPVLGRSRLDFQCFNVRATEVDTREAIQSG